MEVRESISTIDEYRIDSWNNYFENSTGLLRLPLDFPRGSKIFSKSYQKYLFSLPLASADISQLYPHFLTVFQIFLAMHADQNDFVIAIKESAIRINSEVFKTYAELLNFVGQSIQRCCLRPPSKEILSQLNISTACSCSPPDHEFEIELQIEANADTILLIWHYRSDLFRDTSIIRFAERYWMLLKLCIENQDIALNKLSCLTDHDYRFLQQQRSSYLDVAFPNKRVHRYIEEQAFLHPYELAVVCQGATISYEELNHYSNQMARYFRKLGIKNNSIVVLCAAYSPKIVITLLAITKAGAVFAPIDVNYPEQRIGFMVQDSGCQLLVTDTLIAHKFNSLTCSLFMLDQDWDKLAFESTSNLDGDPDSDDLVHAIYTSGTTGNPKASTTRHSSFMNLLWWYIQEFNISTQTKKLVFTSLSFDLTHRNIYATLMQGGVVHLMDNRVYDPAEIINYIYQHQISSFNCTPSAFYPLIEFDPSQCSTLLSSLRWVFLGGEPISIKRLQHLAGPEINFKIVNLYGPCECADVTLYYQLTKMDFIQLKEIPAGKPTPNAEIYILDHQQRLTPPGSVGELYIAGIPVGKGYLNRSQLNQEKFLKGLIGKQDKLFYRTGDLGQYLSDGNIMYLGRIDQQIKLRGFRIELEEIENKLRQYPGLTDVLVMVRNDDQRQALLVAYIISPTIPSLDQHKIFQLQMNCFLNQDLPHFMIPAHYVFLPSFPLTANGKINRGVLPPPNYELQAGNEQDYLPARSGIETDLVELFSEILSIKKIGINDNFFHLGGHSLSATKLVAKIRSKWDVTISLGQFIENPTINYLVKQINNAKTDEYSIPRFEFYDRSQLIPLSYAQQRLWIAEQLLTNASIYNVNSIHRIKGNLEIQKLQSALNLLVQRHESLRTIIKNDDLEQRQEPQDWQEMPFTIIKLDSENSLKTFLETETQRPFELSQGPLIRCTLIHLKPLEYVLLVSFHHIIFDGWSLAVFYKELQALYLAAINGTSAKLPSMTFHYADFSVWQRKLLDQQLLNKQTRYWQERLRNIPNLSQLPADKPKISRRTYQAASYQFQLDSATVGRLQHLAQQQNVTLFILLFTIFQILIFRFTYQQRLVIGTPIANRRFTELENIIGFFVNMLPIDAHLTEDINFFELLAKMKQTILNAYEYQDTPFELIVDSLHIPRDFNYNPIFQIVFILHNMESMTLEFPGLEVTKLQNINLLAKFDLVLAVEEINEQLHCCFEYSKDLYHDSTIERLAQSYVNLISSVLDNPASKIMNLSLLSAHDNDKIKQKFVGIERNYALNTCLHQLFENIVLQFPDKSAIHCQTEVLTFKQLNQQANQLARLLFSMQLRPGDFVGVCLNRSNAFIVTLLAILKLGCVYVPLEPSHPLTALNAILEDTHPKLIVTENELQTQFDFNYPSILVNDFPSLLEKWGLENLNLDLDKDSLIYILYTSGSTGKPKGVLGKHSTILNRFFWMWDVFPFSADDKCCFIAPIHNIDLIWESLGPLLQGIPVWIFASEIVKNPHIFIETLAELGITRIDFVPSFLKVFLDLYPDLHRQLPKLNYWGLNGDAVSKNLIERFSQKMPDRHLIIRYGATEATTIYFEYYRSDCQGCAYLQLWGPISNTRIWILDSNKQTVPVGVVGDIYVEGPTVAAGYLNHPEQTYLRFQTGKYLPVPPRFRVYKMGDQGRWLDNGQLIIQGREDNLVKIRGFRVDLTEVENAFLINDTVKDAVVVVKKDQFDESKLIAYIVLKSAELNEYPYLLQQIKNQIQNSLPLYMHPAKIIILESLPLTLNAKVDRKYLISQELEPLVTNNENLSTADSPVQNKLWHIWQELFGFSAINPTDNFFEIGGHSLLGMRLVALIRKEFKVEISLRDIFLYPTLLELAKIIMNAKKITQPLIRNRKSKIGT